MEGPSKAEITFEDRKDGSCGVSYVVQEPGERSCPEVEQTLGTSPEQRNSGRSVGPVNPLVTFSYLLPRRLRGLHQV